MVNDDLSNALVLRRDNPFSIGRILQLDDGELTLEGGELIYTPSPKDGHYTVTQGDTLQNIAYRRYGNSKYYWVIAKVNNILFALDLTLGMELIVPDLDHLFSSQPKN